MNDLLNNLNEEQKNAVIYKNGPLLIIAGAGTGKTTVITTRIAWLILFNQIKSEEILALTFTDKAAEEMEERVDRLLPYGYVDLWISTFHSFAERILKQHAIDIGLPDNFKLLNQTGQNFLIRRNFDRFNLDYYRPLGNPTKFIQAMIKHFSRAKDEEIWPEDYLEYVEGLKDNLDNSLSGGVKITNSKLQIPNKFKIQNSKLVVSEVEPFRILNSDNFEKKLNQEITSQEISRLEEIADAYHIYQQLLLENSALDFGDLINYTLKLFRTRPQILEKYRKQFKYILVDEFQDTNWAQYELIKLLGAPKNNITVSFDDDQSIYKFRGASISNVMQFKKDYPKAEQVVLIKNYRSKQNILDLAYDFIQKNNPNRLEWQLRNYK
ncbi:UvrD-helicase domain-containing protein [Candidatus Kuenenbacteria bacterium]|nr:UvrD-helicase domain-containing protein [Candidatus Kuenenbacteria bacterium]